jgi:hypothetical protein
MERGLMSYTEGKYVRELFINRLKEPKLINSKG